MKPELLKGLTEEQIALAKQCHGRDELLSLASKEGVELTAEQLAFVTGGGCGGKDKDEEKPKKPIIED